MVSQFNIENFIKAGRVTIFSKSYCPYCVWAKKLFADIETEITVYEVDLETNKFNKAAELVLHNDSKFSTYPKIYIGTKCYGGYNDVSKLLESTRLFEILKSEEIRFIDDDMF